MGSPYESFGDDRVALIVDLETTIVHEPRPRALDDPPSWEHFEAMVMDLVHHLGRDVVCPARGDEGLFEACRVQELPATSLTSNYPLDDADSPWYFPSSTAWLSAHSDSCASIGWTPSQRMPRSLCYVTSSQCFAARSPVRVSPGPTGRSSCCSPASCRANDGRHSSSRRRRSLIGTAASSEDAGATPTVGRVDQCSRPRPSSSSAAWQGRILGGDTYVSSASWQSSVSPCRRRAWPPSFADTGFLLLHVVWARPGLSSYVPKPKVSSPLTSSTPMGSCSGATTCSSSSRSTAASYIFSG